MDNFCTKCGSSLEKNISFCVKCGAKTNSESNPNNTYNISSKKKLSKKKKIGIIFGVIILLFFVAVASSGGTDHNSTSNIPPELTNEALSSMTDFHLNDYNSTGWFYPDNTGAERYFKNYFENTIHFMKHLKSNQHVDETEMVYLVIGMADIAKNYQYFDSEGNITNFDDGCSPLIQSITAVRNISQIYDVAIGDEWNYSNMSNTEYYERASTDLSSSFLKMPYDLSYNYIKSSTELELFLLEHQDTVSYCYERERNPESRKCSYNIESGQLDIGLQQCVSNNSECRNFKVGSTNDQENFHHLWIQCVENPDRDFTLDICHVFDEKKYFDSPSREYDLILSYDKCVENYKICGGDDLTLNGYSFWHCMDDVSWTK